MARQGHKRLRGEPTSHGHGHLQAAATLLYVAHVAIDGVTNDGTLVFGDERAMADQLIAKQIGGDTSERLARQWERWKAAENFEEEPAFPLEVDIETQFRCNLKCPMCIMSLSRDEQRHWGSPEVRMSFDEAKAIVREVASAKGSALVLNGTNEPLLTAWLPDLVAYARAQGIVDVAFSTNATLLNEKRARALLNAGLTRMSISLDANTRETYERVRVGGKFDRVISNIHRFFELRAELGTTLPVVTLCAVVTKVNQHEIGDFIARWSGVADFVNIQPFFNPYDGTGQQDAEDSLRCHDSIESVSAVSLGEPSDVPAEFRCSQPFQRIVVRNTGELLPCCSWYGMRIPMGNVKDSSIREIWDSPKYREFRRLHAEGAWAGVEACKQCVESGWRSTDLEHLRFLDNNSDSLPASSPESGGTLPAT